MKKHLLTLVLALLLATLTSVAAAQDYYTLPEIREQAGQGWHQMYTDKYGRTRQVDVDIDVFGEETAPVVKACWGTKYFNIKGPAGEPRAANQEARKKKNREDIYIYNEDFMKVNLDEKYMEAYANDLTLREAYDFCEGVMQERGMSLYQDYMWEQPQYFEALYTADMETGELLVPGMYDVKFCQKELGMPILTHIGRSFGELQVAFGCPFFNFQIRDQESCSFIGKVFDVEEVLAEDIPLCSVDTAIEGARAMIESGWVHDVLALRFGYVVYGDPELDWTKRFTGDDVENWYLVPSWVMDCYVLWDAKKDELPEYPTISQIAINAQTGEITDYFDTSLKGGGDVRFKGFISWNNVK